MKNTENIKPDLLVFKNFVRARYLLILGFVFSSFLLNLFFLPLFLDLNFFKILIWNLFFFSLTFFLFSFFVFFFLFNKKEQIIFAYNLLRVILIIILLTVFINIVFLLKMNNLIDWSIVNLIAIFCPFQIVLMFIGISSSTKIFHDWQKSFLKNNLKKEINKKQN